MMPEGETASLLDRVLYVMPADLTAAHSALFISLIALMVSLPVTVNAQFGPEQIIDRRGGKAEVVHAADLDGDDDKDVLAATANGTRVVWFESESGRDFGSEQVISTSTTVSAASLHAADLDADGDNDVLVAFEGVDEEQWVVWFENDGTGSFGPEQIVTSDVYGVREARSADLDGDGDLDVFSAVGYDSEIEWYENNGNGVFEAPQVITGGVYGVESAYASDLDDDGDHDVLYVSYYIDEVAWLENDGSGQFGPKQVISTDVATAWAVHAKDLDGDGSKDVLSASSDDNKVAWYRNEGDGSFGEQMVLTSAYGGEPRQVYATDMDGDTDNDVVAALWGSNEVVWFENEGAGLFSSRRVVTDKAYDVRSIYAEDLDGDGDKDILSASFDTDAREAGKVMWIENLLGPPSNPGGLAAIAGKSLVKLNWNDNADSDLVGYNIYRNTYPFVNRSSATKINGSPVSSANYTDNGVTNGFTYYYAVTAVDSDGNESDLSNLVFETPADYLLTRQLPDNTIEPFSFSRHTWSFGNVREDIWPSEDYVDYTDSIYPADWQEPPILAGPNDFPSWPSYVDAFGVQASSLNNDAGYLIPPDFPGGPAYNPYAEFKWSYIKNEINDGAWRGSCAGFAITSLLFFDGQLSVDQVFPEEDASASRTLRDIGSSTSSRRLINAHWLSQYTIVPFLPFVENEYRSESPVEALQDIIDSFDTDTDSHLVLYLLNPEDWKEGPHTVTPYRVAEYPAGSGVYRIFVYDSNDPTRPVFVTVNTNTNTWTYSEDFPDWTSSLPAGRGLIAGPSADYFSVAYDPADAASQSSRQQRLSAHRSAKSEAPAYVEIYSSDDQDIVIENESGESIGFTDGSDVDEMGAASPIVHFNPGFSLERPPGYVAVDTSYDVTIDNFQGSTAELTWLSQEAAYVYRRDDASDGQRDEIALDQGMTISNPDEVEKQIALDVAGLDSTEARTFSVRNLALEGAGEVNAALAEEGANLDLTNLGAGKTYSLRLEFRSSEGVQWAEFESIDVPAGQRHTLSPDWDNLLDSSLAIEVDEDLDGQLDETIEVEPTQTLPVELSAFQAIQDGERIRLTWATLSETDNAGFAVQRKTETSPSFERIGYVTGAGTTTERTAYQFVDEALPSDAARMTYRLKQIDVDGSSEYSEEVEVRISAPDRLTLHRNYPNPFTRATTIRYELPQTSNVRLEVYDVQGRRVEMLVDEKQSVGIQEVNWRAQGIASGVYFLRLQVAGQVRTQRVHVVR